MFLFSVQNFCKSKLTKNPVFRDFSPVGVRSAKTEKLTKVRTSGKKILGHRELHFFRFRPSPGISLTAKGRPRPKWPKVSVLCRVGPFCRPWGSVQAKLKT